MHSPVPLGIGLAGLGLHGVRYARHLLNGDIPGARLAAIHRRDRQAGRSWADQHGVRHADSLADLVHLPDVQIVVLVLPPALHAEAIIVAAEAGKAVFVEKPLAVDETAALQATITVRARGVPAMVAQTLRFNTTVLAVKQRIASLGPLSLLAINQRFEPANRSWLDDPVHGGLVSNTGVHGLDLLRWFSGAEIRVARALARVPPGRQMEDQFAAVLELQPGALLATLDNTRTTAARSGRIEICGQHGQLVADHVHGTLLHLHTAGREAITLPPAHPTVSATLCAFVEAVRHGRPSPIPLEEGLAAVAAAAQIRRALAATSSTET